MNATDPRGDLGAAIEDLAHRVLVPDEQIRTEVAHALDRKTKPRNSLGRLEDLASTVAAIRRTPLPELPIPAIVLAAGDHGITAEGVSAYPAEVTGQMVLSFLGGGAAVNVLAREAGARLVLVDAGILAPIDAPGIRQVRLGSGTQSFVAGPAMTAEQAVPASSPDRTSLTSLPMTASP